MFNIPTRFRLVLGLWLLGATSLLAQRTYPPETAEPPLADPSKPNKLPSKFDPDETSGVTPAQYIVPSRPTSGPSNISTPLPMGVVNPGTLTVGAGESVPYEVIPTPMVTLNIEGSNDSPTGQTIVYKLHVRNVSRAKAHNVVLRVTPPKNATKVKADPPATHDDAETKWDLKILEPGQLRTIEVTYMPKADTDEVKILARVQFDFGRGMITHVSAPALKITKEGPEKLILGDTGNYRIVVKNTGKVTIRDIEIREMLDKGLAYDSREMSRGTIDGKLVSSVDPKSGDRTWSISGLAPGQTQVLEYRVKANALGKKTSTTMAKFPGGPEIPKPVDHETDVLSANLEMKAVGPNNDRGVVGQAAGYRVTVVNRGNATLSNVCVRCIFPPDMRVTRATQSGQPFRDHVQWIFKELKPGETQEVTVSLTTASPGQRTVQFAAKADKGNDQRSEVKTEFGGVPSLSWDTDVPGVASVGKKITYTVTVSNSGTATANKVQLRLDLPNNVDLIDTAPPSGRGTGANARQVIFPPQNIMAGKKTTFTVEVKARSAGEARAIFQLYSEATGNEPAEHRKSTNITDVNNRSPNGPPPKIDPSTVGYPPNGG